MEDEGIRSSEEGGHVFRATKKAIAISYVYILLYKKLNHPSSPAHRGQYEAEDDMGRMLRDLVTKSDREQEGCHSVMKHGTYFISGQPLVICFDFFFGLTA